MVDSHKTIGARAVVRYDHVVTNLGGAYRSTTGIFTAPFRGLYSFSYSLMSYPSNEVHLEMVKNGKRVSKVYSAPNTYPQSSQTLYLILNRGDTICIENSSSDKKAMLYEDTGGYNTFSGTLIRII